MRTTIAAFLAAVALVAGSGCISSESCEAVICLPLPPALSASVHDSVDGGIVHSAVVNGFPFECPTHCTVRFPDGGTPAGPGPVPLLVTAPGYATHTETVLVHAPVDNLCCIAPYEAQQVDVALVPL